MQKGRAGLTQFHKMLSFGYCEKVEINGYKPIGHYGNGFKSGSMRIGKDALVFTKDQTTMSVGFLSQTYLKEINAKTVLVPLITFEKNTMTVKPAKDAKGSLQAITCHSLFKSQTEILLEFQALDQFPTGTRIIIYNLNRGADNKLELDLTSNLHDIINSEHQALDMSVNYRPIKDYQPEYRRSLREYCSILYLKPRMKIILRGKKVHTKLISKSLSRTERDVYKPLWLNKAVKITFGFSNQQQDYGIMMYHRNRLIKAYERVGYQKQANQLGMGVVGVVSVDFLEPIHNKQDFSKTDRYNATMNALAQKLNDYWNEKNNVIDIEADDEVIPTDKELPPDWTWVQCDNCLKWRRMPLGSNEKDLPEKWFCYMNPDPIHNRCDVEEEPEDEDELLNRATYEKTFKKYQEKGTRQSVKRIQERERQLRIQEKELLVARKQLEDIRQAPPEVSSSEDKKPSMEELVIALEEAKRREAEQQAIIEKLKYAKESVKQQQQKLSEVVANEASARKESQESSVSSTSMTSFKRKADMSGIPGKRVCLEESEFIVTANASDEDDDIIVLDSDNDGDDSNVRNNSDNNENEMQDIKPDVDELNRLIQPQDGTDDDNHDNHGSASEKSNMDAEENIAPESSMSKSSQLRKTSGKPSSDKSNTQVVPSRPSPSHRTTPSTSTHPKRAISSPQTQVKSSIPKTTPKMTIKFPFKRSEQEERVERNDRIPQHLRSSVRNAGVVGVGKPHQVVHRGVQTVKEEVEESEDCRKLHELRDHVSQLLAIIAPEVDLGDLKNIDDIVQEMIRVNSSQRDSDDSDSS